MLSRLCPFNQAPAIMGICFLISLVILMPSLEEHNGGCLTSKLLVKRDGIQTQRILVFNEILFSFCEIFYVTTVNCLRLREVGRSSSSLYTDAVSWSSSACFLIILNASQVSSHLLFFFFLKSSVFKSHYFNYIQLNVLA